MSWGAVPAEDPSQRETNQPSKCSIKHLRLQDRLLTLSTFVLLSVILGFVLYSFDMLLGNENHGAYPNNRQWTDVPRLQSLFAILLLSMLAEVSIRLGKGPKKIPIKIQISLASFFVLISCFFVVTPSLVFERFLPPTVFDLQQGNKCIDLTRDLKLTQQKDLLQACAMYSPLEETPMLTVSQLWRNVNKSLPEPVTFNSLLRLLSTINDIKSLIPAITTGRNADRILPKWTALSAQSKLFFSIKCVQHFADTSCTLFFSPCSYKNCKSSGTRCVSNHGLDRWIQCASRTCEAQQLSDCDEINERNLLETLDALGSELGELLKNPKYANS